MFEEPKDENIKNLLIYKKGREIYDVVLTIANLIPEENDHLQEIISLMLSDAANMSVKIAGAYHTELYDLKMEAATIIRKSARDLVAMSNSLKMFGFNEMEYFSIVRELVEEYRLLFIDWIESFNPWDYIIDDWGLFNPPGIKP